jgi:hypothetical protein
MTVATAERTLNITYVEPVYGVNYNKGYIGFTYDSDNPIAQGIAYFTKWDQIHEIHASHVLIVTGEDSCIEADGATNRVHEVPLAPYFAPSNKQVFFRKPVGLTDEIADRIVNVLRPEIGKTYDFFLILAHALAGSVPGHVIDRLSGKKLSVFLCEALNNPDSYICSELAAYALDQQPEYKDEGTLALPDSTISPQELFEDDVTFEAWKREIPESYRRILMPDKQPALIK